MSGDARIQQGPGLFDALMSVSALGYGTVSPRTHLRVNINLCSEGFGPAHDAFEGHKANRYNVVIEAVPATHHVGFKEQLKGFKLYRQALEH